MPKNKDPMTKVYIVWVKAKKMEQELKFEKTLDGVEVVVEWKKQLPLKSSEYQYDRK